MPKAARVRCAQKREVIAAARVLVYDVNAYPKEPLRETCAALVTGEDSVEDAKRRKLDHYMAALHAARPALACPWRKGKSAITPRTGGTLPSTPPLKLHLCSSL